ncbi:hypothetical protein [Aliarcobacter butzleri]|uniref:hypothetical protein n=1 Tax=Aliarcobacter butzleri TaxID=28197 RepID=UPI002B2550A0|nr:hypothetical protein [Aliarcobacter butzleri]
MANSIKKNFLFFSKDGFTYDKSNKLTNNMQLLGSGIGKNLSEAFNDFKKNQSYLLTFDYENLMAVKTIGKFITNLKLKGEK